jgi:hypothetical protein
MCTCVKIDLQGEMVDNIMQNVLRASDDVEKGRDHLKKAEEYAISSRKMKLILAAIGLILGSILQNSISAEKFSDKFSSSNLGHLSTLNKSHQFIRIM